MNTEAADQALYARKFDGPIVLWMVLIHALAIPAFFMFTWTNFAVFFALYFLTCCLGITLGYHRLLTHRTMKMSKGWERVFATFGVLALQGSPLEWVGHHRMHHAHSDTPDDPHNAREGFWHCHWGWLFVRVQKFDDWGLMTKYARDIARDPYYRLLENMWVQIAIQVAFGMVLLAIGGLGMVFWGIFFRIVWCYHCTWLVNSLTHFMGYKTYETGDLARNNWLVGILAWGEGWHNNHHAHQDLAPAGHKWWEIDVTMWCIRVLEVLGIAYDVKDKIPFQEEVSSDSAESESNSGISSPISIQEPAGLLN